MSLLRRYRTLCILLAGVLVLLSLTALVWWHGEWWYPILREWRGYEEVDLTETELTVETRQWTLDGLLTREDIVFSDALMLVNAAHLLPEGYEATLVEYNGAYMNPRMVDSYIALRDAVQEKTDVRIYVASDFRTAEEQAELVAAGRSSETAGVGASEHQTGLALDLYAKGFDGMRFLRSPAGRTVNDVCHEYGFIIRYPKGEEKITGISYEPWHLRYVGAPHARIIGESGITLEEYIELLAPNVWYASGEYLISRRTPDSLILPTAWQTCEISPDNTGHYVVTIKLP